MDGAVPGGRRGTGDYQVSWNSFDMHTHMLLHNLPRGEKNSSMPATSQNILINTRVIVTLYNILTAVLTRAFLISYVLCACFCVGDFASSNS